MYSYLIYVTPGMWGEIQTYSYLIKENGETKAVPFTGLSELLTSKRKITQAEFEKMDGVVFRWHEFSPEKVVTPPKDVTAMDTKTVTAYKLEGESADEKLLWRVCDIGQVGVLEELKDIMRIMSRRPRKQT